MQAEGELRSNLEESDRVRELQDKVAELKAEVSNRCLDSFLKEFIQVHIKQTQLLSTHQLTHSSLIHSPR